jgi:hypothetical protein
MTMTKKMADTAVRKAKRKERKERKAGAATAKTAMKTKKRGKPRKSTYWPPRNWWRHRRSATNTSFPRRERSLASSTKASDKGCMSGYF